MITSRHVLTAAHCISPLLQFARFGEHDTRKTSDGVHQDVPVAHTESHDGFSWKWKINDIAIVYLAHDVAFDGETNILNFKFDRSIHILSHSQCH